MQARSPRPPVPERAAPRRPLRPARRRGGGAPRPPRPPVRGHARRGDCRQGEDREKKDEEQPPPPAQDHWTDVLLDFRKFARSKGSRSVPAEMSGERPM